MKKIDLHIHTIASPVKDPAFDFDIEKLVSYVKLESLDVIAVTNHNLFDVIQFQRIMDRLDKEGLKTKVFPGVEIDLENGHVLYITDISRITELKLSCEKLNNEIVTETDSIDFNKFVEFFPNYHDALIIPHGEGKKPMLHTSIVKKFGESISTVEVQNQKKFLVLKKSNDLRTPLLFSDVRISSELDIFPKRCTFVDIEDISIPSLKATLADKAKVYINDNPEREEVFQVDESGSEASVGLNVILGARATGKTFLMDKIASAFPNTKYIKQFQLMSDESKSDQTFKSNINKWLNSNTSSFLREYSNVLTSIGAINIEDNETELDTFVESLLGNASDLEMNDEFSKSKLFNADLIQNVSVDKLKDLINALDTILDPGKDYKELVDTYFDSDSIKELLLILIDNYETKAFLKYIISETNKVIGEVREGLKQKTAVTQISNFDEIKYVSDKLRITLFNEYTLRLRAKGEFINYDMHGFKVVAECISDRIVSASVLKKINDNKGNFSALKSVYQEPYTYLTDMKKDISISSDNIVKLLIPTRVRVLNKHGKDVSGGEKSEFNLMNALNDAYLYDMLIVDEPESSFDNIFLNQSVNKILKEISQKMPVFVVTHNSSIGASIKPDYLLYTKMNFDSEGNVSYSIYTGKPTNRYLKNSNGDQIKNYNIQMDSLEGGHDEYKQRGVMYGGIEKS